MRVFIDAHVIVQSLTASSPNSRKNLGEGRLRQTAGTALRAIHRLKSIKLGANAKRRLQVQVKISDQTLIKARANVFKFCKFLEWGGNPQLALRNFFPSAAE